MEFTIASSSLRTQLEWSGSELESVMKLIDESRRKTDILNSKIRKALDDRDGGYLSTTLLSVPPDVVFVSGSNWSSFLLEASRDLEFVCFEMDVGGMDQKQVWILRDFCKELELNEQFIRDVTPYFDQSAYLSCN